jgi:hypothetical protein
MVWRRNKENLNGLTDMRQLSGDDQAISTVVAFANDNPDTPAVGELALDGSDNGTAGMFHQDHAGDADIFNRLLVNSTHLACCDDFHNTRFAVQKGDWHNRMIAPAVKNLDAFITSGHARNRVGPQSQAILFASVRRLVVAYPDRFWSLEWLRSGAQGFGNQ